MRVGIIGHRSWIADWLRAELRSHEGVELTEYEKRWSAADAQGFAELDCMFLIPGRTNPTVDEMGAELDLVLRLIVAGGPSLRVVCLGSTAAATDTEYGIHKRILEDLVTRHPWAKKWRVIRAPAVFGPGQPADSPMLVPSIAREGGSIALRNPDSQTDFVCVDKLVEYMVNVGLYDYELAYKVPGTFTMTPRQMVSLWTTWNSYRQRP